MFAAGRSRQVESGITVRGTGSADGLPHHLHRVMLARADFRFCCVGEAVIPMSDDTASRLPGAPAVPMKRSKQTREEYRANSLTARQPWVALGISRATYYRQQRQPAEITPRETGAREISVPETSPPGLSRAPKQRKCRPPVGDFARQLEELAQLDSRSLDDMRGKSVDPRAKWTKELRQTRDRLVGVGLRQSPKPSLLVIMEQILDYLPTLFREFTAGGMRDDHLNEKKKARLKAQADEAALRTAAGPEVMAAPAMRLPSGKRLRARKVRPGQTARPPGPPNTVWVGNVLYAKFSLAKRRYTKSLRTSDSATAAVRVAVFREERIADIYYGGIGKPSPRYAPPPLNGKLPEPPPNCYWLRGTLWTAIRTKGYRQQRSLRTDNPEIGRQRAVYVREQLRKEFDRARQTPVTAPEIDAPISRLIITKLIAAPGYRLKFKELNIAICRRIDDQIARLRANGVLARGDRRWVRLSPDSIAQFKRDEPIRDRCGRVRWAPPARRDGSP